MALPPNIDNYTVPGGIKLFFDDGTGERDLGNIVSLDMTPGTDELEHFTNRSGKRSKDHSLVLEEKLTMKLVLDEIVAEHLKYFFKGSSITNVGAGTASLTDQKVTLTAEILSSVGAYYGLSSVSARQFLDYFLVYDDSGVTYIDNSNEADTSGGSAFEIFSDAADFIYLGKLTPFKQVYFDLTTLGSVGARDWEYWNGSTWSNLSGIGGTGEDFSVDGTIYWTLPGDWTLYSVDAKEAYWVRCKVASVTTPPTVLSVRGALVRNTDYIVDFGVAATDGRIVGKVGRLASGLLADGEEIKVNFTYTTWTSQRFDISTGAMPIGAARIEMHPSDGRGNQVDIEIPKCQLKPDGTVKLDDKDWMQLPLTLEVLDDSTNHPTYPMGRVVIYEV